MTQLVDGTTVPRVTAAQRRTGGDEEAAGCISREPGGRRGMAQEAAGRLGLKRRLAGAWAQEAAGRLGLKRRLAGLGKRRPGEKNFYTQYLPWVVTLSYFFLTTTLLSLKSLCGGRACRTPMSLPCLGGFFLLSFFTKARDWTNKTMVF